MSRGNRSDQRGASPAAADSSAPVDDAPAVDASAEAPAEPETAPAPVVAPSGTSRFVVTHGTVHHDGRAYVVGEYIPVSDAQAMLMPWAVERR